MQIQYNITRIEEWCKSHNMPEGTLQLEHLTQATKLLQLKKATAADIEIIYDVCWMLSPSQIQRMCTNYFVADYEVSLDGIGIGELACSQTCRTRSRQRSCGSSRRASSLMTGMTTYSSRRRARTWGRTSCRCRGMSLDWRRTCLRT